MTNTDAAFRKLNMDKASANIAMYQAQIEGASEIEAAFIQRLIASNQQVLDDGRAMIEAGY